MTAFSAHRFKIIGFDTLLMSLQVVFRGAGSNKAYPKSGSLNGSVVT